MRICENSNCKKELTSRWQKRFCSCSCRAKILLKGKRQRLGYKNSKRWHKLFKEKMIGHPVSKETRKKLSLIFKGRTYEERFGKEKAEILKKQNSLQRKGHHYTPKGENNHLWLGGIRIFYESGMNNKIRKEVRRRDNYICQCCGKKEKKLCYKLHTHHKDFKGYNHNLENLISICRRCHLKIHKNHYQTEVLWHS